MMLLTMIEDYRNDFVPKQRNCTARRVTLLSIYFGFTMYQERRGNNFTTTEKNNFRVRAPTFRLKQAFRLQIVP